MRGRSPFLRFLYLALFWLSCISQAQAGNVLIIANANVPKFDAKRAERLYTGKSTNVNGVLITAVNMASGSDLRNRFLDTYLSQDNEKYEAYWTVRRYIGQGTPPKEVSNPNEMINFIQNTPGAVGYIDESDLKPGLNVILRP